MSDGTSTENGTSAGTWFTGPDGGRHDYAVADPARFLGGQGEVFLAELRRDSPIVVSLKQLSGASPQRASELLERDDLLLRLNHPGLARHIETFRGPGLFQRGDIDVDDLTSDLVYVAAEWVPGTPLGDMARAPTVDEAIRVLRDVAAAVAYLHENGLTHRDLHPGNVVLTDAGRGVVIDLGHTSPITEHATTLMRGAAGFIPPERNQDPSVASMECDLFQIGALAVYLLLGDPHTRTPLPDIAAKLQARLDSHVADPDGCAQSIVDLLAADPRLRPIDLAAWASQLATDPLAPPSSSDQLEPGARHGTRRQILSVAAVAIVIVAGVVGAWRVGILGASPKPQRPKTAKAADRCPFGVGQAAAGLPAASAKFLPAIAAEAAVHGGCASSGAYQYGPMVVQKLGPPGAANGAVIASVAGRAIYLTQAQWGSYTQIGGKNGNEAPIAAGPPLSVTNQPGVSEIYLTHGLLLGAGPDQPHFWIPEVAVPVWQHQGGVSGPLGLPTSNPYPRAGDLEQDYETGYMSLAHGSNSIQIVETPNPAAALPAGRALAGKLINQIDGTAWYIDTTGTRHWIPDGGVWDCHGGSKNVAASDLTGYAVATLPLGAPAHC